MATKRFEIARETEASVAAFQHMAMRIAAEMDFAAGLAELRGRQGEWRRLLARAEEQVKPALAAGDLTGLKKAVASAEEILAPIGKIAKEYLVILVGHAHIDMNWMWSWPETCAVTNDTFTTVLRLMEEYPEFHFSQSQASVYALAEQHNPPLFAGIQRRVREGRWEITASHWVEGDKNLASAESLCRHLLYTRRFFQERFGLTPDDVPIDWSPDTFGHAATIPMYLQRGRVKYYYGHRFGNDVPERPPVFFWEGPDGSRVLVRNDCRNGYNGVVDDSLGRRLLAYAKETGLRTFMFVYGVGDHGGGPTRRDICRALDMKTWPIFPEIRFGTARDYYQKVEIEAAKCKLPVLRGELNFEFTGCYTSQSLIKKANRFAETKLVAAEAAAALAWTIFGANYPTAAFQQAWQDTLFCHFHDILPGSGVHDTRTYCHGLFQKTAAAASMAETNALRLLAARVDTNIDSGQSPTEMPPAFLQNGVGAGVGFDTNTGNISGAEMSAGAGPRPFLLFNPCGHSRREVVTAMVWDNDPGSAMLWQRSGHGTRLQNAPWQVLGPQGAAAAQIIDSGHYWGHQYVRLAFAADEIPPFGYGLYTLKEGEAEAAGESVRLTGPQSNCFYAPLEHLRLGMENSLIAMEIDPATGGIRSLRDRRSGVEIIDPQHPSCRLGFAVERPHGMTAWTVMETGAVEFFEVKSIQRKAAGPYVAQIEVNLRRGDNSFTLVYEMRAGDPHLHITVSGTWVERGNAERGVPVLRMFFPTGIEGGRGRYEIPFGAIDRPQRDGEEVPALQWAILQGKVKGKSAGLLLLNDSKHGHSVCGNTLRLTLIRSSYDPDPLPEVGQHSVRMAISPVAGDLSVAEAIQRGDAFNQPLRVVSTDVHKGDLPRAGATLAVSPSSLIVTALKKAEDDDALIVRFFETAGKKTRAEIKANAAILGKIQEAVEVDLHEKPLAKSTAKLAGGRATVEVPAYGLTSLRLKFNRT